MNIIRKLFGSGQSDKSEILNKGKFLTWDTFSKPSNHFKNRLSIIL
jgi:hypothetical protein